MSEIRRKIFENGRIPLMSDEGMSELIRCNLEYFRTGAIKLVNGNTVRGYQTTRIIRLEGHKERASNEYVDESFVAGTRCDVLCAILKKLREEKDINKVRQGIARIFPAVTYMSDDEVRAIINTPDEAIYGYFVDGKGTVSESLKKMYETYTNYDGEHAGKRSDMPYECISGNSAENTYRIYINLPQNKTTYEFWRRFRLKCIERGVSFDAKTSNSVGGTNTLDAQIIYVSEEEADFVFGILEELAVEIPEITEVAGTPISGAMQYSYYSVSTAKIQNNTFNNVCNELTRRAIYCAVAREILNDTEFCSKLSPRQIECLQIFANYENHSAEIANGQTGGLGNKMLSWKEVKIDPYTGEPYETGYNDMSLIQPILIQYAKTHNVEDSREFREYFEEAFKGLFSCFNYGDFEHMDAPIALPPEFFEGMGMEMPKREASTPKPSTPKPATGTAKPKSTPSKSVPTATPEQHQMVVQNIDDAMIKVIQEFMTGYEKDPATATEVLLTKMAQLKEQYMVSTMACGATNTPKYQYMMNMFKVFEQFPMFVEDTTKGSGINLGNKKRHYREMSTTLRGRAQSVGTALVNFDKVEDKEAMEQTEIEKPKQSEGEYRRNLVENIVDIILQTFKEFVTNFEKDPAKATEVLITKLAQLKKDYITSVALVGGKNTSKYATAMKAFERLDKFKQYENDPTKGDAVNMGNRKNYYYQMAWDVNSEVRVISNRLDTFDIKD